MLMLYNNVKRVYLIKELNLTPSNLWPLLLFSHAENNLSIDVITHSFYLINANKLNSLPANNREK